MERKLVQIMEERKYSHAHLSKDKQNSCDQTANIFAHFGMLEGHRKICWGYRYLAGMPLMRDLTRLVGNHQIRPRFLWLCMRQHCMRKQGERFQCANFTTYSNVSYYHLVEKQKDQRAQRSWKDAHTKWLATFSICTDLHVTLLFALICVLHFNHNLLLFTMQTHIHVCKHCSWSSHDQCSTPSSKTCLAGKPQNSDLQTTVTEKQHFPGPAPVQKTHE